MPAIILDMEITRDDENYLIEWSAGCGVAGFVTAKHVRIGVALGHLDNNYLYIYLINITY